MATSTTSDAAEKPAQRTPKPSTSAATPAPAIATGSNGGEAPPDKTPQANQKPSQSDPRPAPVSQYPPEVMEALSGRALDQNDPIRQGRHARLFETALGVTLMESDHPLQARIQKALQIADVSLVIEELYQRERGLPSVPVVPR